MKLEVGHYFRTNSGNIGKVISNGFQLVNQGIYGIDSDNEYADLNDLKKHSKNLIDLIEVGDYVNGRLVRKDENERLCILTTVGNWLLINDEIKSILTHKQYEANCYKVGE